MMRKVHLRYRGPLLSKVIACRLAGVDATDDPARVTCKRCLRAIGRPR